MKATVFVGLLAISASILSTAGCDHECEIENRILEDGAVGQHYEQRLTTTCEGDLSWFLFSGEIPPGIALFSDGVLEGVPEIPGTYNFTIGVDRIGNDSDTTNSAAKSFTVTIL
jgi:hypothetical protein